MIKVFSPNDTDYRSNGNIVILPTLAIVHKVDNGDYDLDITCGLDYADYVGENNIIVAPTPQGEQAFRIKTVEKTRSKITIKARHKFYDAENYLIRDSYVVEKNCNDALDHLNAATDNPSPFTTLSDVETVNSFRCVRKSLLEAINTVLERWGGHLIRDNNIIQIRDSIGSDNGVTIQYKKNLKEISVVYDWSNVCTKVLPVGKDGITLDYIYSEVQYATPFTRSVSFEQDIERENYETDEEYIAALEEDLQNKAERYLEISQYPAVTYTLNANVDKITDIGDIIRVYDERLGIDIQTSVLSFDYDCILDKYTQVTFGTAPKSLTGLMSNISTEIGESINENNQVITVTLRDDIAAATQKIWSALSSSYVIYQGNQILIVDSLPAETAINVIRINSGGIGFSNTGINGQFSSAWTIDNILNMENINVINLTADLIKGGTLKLGSNLNQNGDLEVYDAENNLIAQLNNDGLKMFGVDGSYIVLNTSVGFAGYDRNNNKTFWVSKDEFHQKKSVVEEEITLCNKLRFIPIELYDNNHNLVNDGIALVSV